MQSDQKQEETIPNDNNTNLVKQQSPIIDQKTAYIVTGQHIEGKQKDNDIQGESGTECNNLSTAASEF